MNNKVQVPCDSIQCEETQVHFHLLTQADANPAGCLDRVMHCQKQFVRILIDGEQTRRDLDCQFRRT